MTTIAIYHKTVPNAKNPEKVNLLKFFAEGARKMGEQVVEVNDSAVRPTDVGLIQGWLAGEPTTAHLQLRKRVIENQLNRGKYVLTADSNLFLYANTENPLHYLRYSFNGVFPNTGIYFDSIIDPSRWKKISQNLKISLKDYRTTGNHILLLLQRNGGWSMGNFDVQDWALSTINQIRTYSDRPIIIRAHPGDKAAREYLDPNNKKCRLKFTKGITLSKNKNLLDDLTNCWAAVNYNSSPVVGAAIEGVPIFVCDPGKSQSAEIANTDFSKLENPELKDRQKWVERLSMFHWNFDELRSGEAWIHIKRFISNVS